jgi:hypothetical protein
MTDVLLRNWKPRLVCFVLAVIVWYLVKERAQHDGTHDLSPLLPQMTSP